MRSTPSTGGRGTIASFLLLSLLAGAVRGQVFAPRVEDLPDFFQHQKWGKGAADPAGDPDWENGKRDFGWCHYAAVLNQFHFWRKLGYDIVDNGITGNGWLAKTNTELPKLVDDIEALPATTVKVLKDKVNHLLDRRGSGPRKGVDGGLVRTELYQLRENNRNFVKYKSADGGEKVFRADATLFDALQTVLNARDTANLYLVHPTKNLAKLWWSGEGNFHAVTVAGYDATNRKVWFIDPDSNPDPTAANPDPGSNDGNKNENAGVRWKDDEDAPAANQTKKRRFSAAAARPVPANPPGANDITKRFMVVKLVDHDRRFEVTDRDFDRYDGVDLKYLHPLEVIKGAAKPDPVPPPPPGAPKKLEVSPGQTGALPIDRCWFFPAEDTFLPGSFVPGLPGWSAVPIAPGALDPWGNLRPFGGVFLLASSPSFALTDTARLEVDYQTASGAPMAAWDVILGYTTDERNLRCQVFGGEMCQVYDQLKVRIEAPGAGMAVGAFRPPVPEPGINTGANEYSPTLSADQLAMWFSSDRAGGAGLQDIWMTTRRDLASPWSAPVHEANLSSPANESYLAVRGDRGEMFLSSDRAGGLGMMDLWVSTRFAGRWTAPVPLASLNSVAADEDPTITGDGLELFFASNRAGSLGGAIWHATRASLGAPWNAPVRVVELDSAQMDHSPTVSDDGLTLFFSSTRPGAPGSSDFYVATRASHAAAFGPAVNVTEVNSAQWDFNGDLTSDGFSLYLSTYAPGSATADIVRADRVRCATISSGPARTGNDWSAWCRRDPGNAGGLLLAFSAQPPLALPGVLGGLEVGAPFYLMAMGYCDANGRVTLGPISTPAAAGLTLWLQAFAQDAGGGASLGNRLAVTLQL